MTASERLADVFDRGQRDGIETLHSADRELYLIQYFIIEHEMGGLSGYFYNRLPDLELIRSTVDAMRRQRLPELAAILSEALELFSRYSDPEQPTTWGEVLRRYDPTNHFKSLEDRIAALDDYGLAQSNIA